MRVELNLNWIAKTLIIITMLIGGMFFAALGFMLGPKLGIGFAGVCLLGEFCAFAVMLIVAIAD